MKKICLFVAALVMSAMCFASVSTLTFTGKCNGAGTASDGAAWTITSDAAESTWTENDGIHYGTGTKAVKYIKLVTNSIEGTISEIKVTCRNATNSSSSVAATVSITVGGAEFAASQTAPSPYRDELTFSGSAEGAIEILLSRDAAAINALYVKSVVVTYEQAAGFVARPKIEAKDYFTDLVKVSMSAAEGMEIYYTLDGSDPDLAVGATSTVQYNNPFYVASSATIKAVAKNPSTDASSSVEEKEVIKLAFTSVEEANAINKADSVIALSPFIVQDVVMNGANANVYIIDPKGATDGVFLIYVEGGNLGLAKGDSVEGFIGKTAPYHGIPEAKPLVEASELFVSHLGSELEILEPFNWSFAPSLDILNQYVKIEAVTVVGTFTADAVENLTATIGENNFVLRNHFKKAFTFEAGKTYDIYGYGAINETELQLYFIAAEEYVETALDEAVEAGKAVKVVRDGQVIILRGKKAYNLVGAEL